MTNDACESSSEVSCKAGKAKTHEVCQLGTFLFFRKHCIAL